METYRVSHSDIPSELLKKMPVDDALKCLEFFETSEAGLPKRSWGPIEVIAGPWIWEWKLIITIKWNSARVIHMPQELSIGRTMRPIDILVIIYCACNSLFRKEAPPKELMWGQMEWNRYNKERREEYERRPKVWAEKNFFRFCISYLEKKYDWPNEDFDVEFSHADGQLKIKAKDDIVCCPAIGTFNGTLTVSARQLFRRLPKRFVSPTVFIQVFKRKDELIATIGGHAIPARWTEKTIPEETGESFTGQEASSNNSFGADNKIFTEDKANKARDFLRQKLSDVNSDISMNVETEAVDDSMKSTKDIRIKEVMTGTYRVLTGDNFHAYDDDDGVDDCGSYDTQEEAIEAAKLIVDKSIRWERQFCEKPTDPEELYDRYTSFGDDPVISPGTEPHFSAWEYAKARCREICLEPIPTKENQN